MTPEAVVDLLGKLVSQVVVPVMVAYGVYFARRSAAATARTETNVETVRTLVNGNNQAVALAAKSQAETLAAIAPKLAEHLPEPPKP